MKITEGQLLWEPSESQKSATNIAAYMQWLPNNGFPSPCDQQELWQWSTGDIEGFWESLWRYFDVISDTPYEQVCNTTTMGPGVRWFTGSKVNFAEHIMRHEKPGEIALYYASERAEPQALLWDELATQVRTLANKMRSMGVQPGDGVCSILPNGPEIITAMLAAISIGAVWSNAAPEFGAATIRDRFDQIRPKWLFICDGYVFGGKEFGREDVFLALAETLKPELKQIIIVPVLQPDRPPPLEGSILWKTIIEGEDPGRDQFKFERVSNDHPLWFVFSSGTTGIPKAIAHSHIGVLLLYYKQLGLEGDFGPDDRMFFYTTTGWIVFNVVVASMLVGAKPILYDGNPAWPNVDTLWRLAEKFRATVFGASPAFVQVMKKAGIVPKDKFDLAPLRAIICSGAPTPPEIFAWFYENVKSDIWVNSQSGGTELAGAFVGASPLLPVLAGEIQAIQLGMAVEVWDAKGKAIINEIGELVCTKPFPSMPLYFLNDENNERYRASYFEDFAGVWRHGDFAKINERGGSYIYGRSDATLNRHGVRIGSAEIYRVVEQLEGVRDSLVVCIDRVDDSSYMPLFVQLEPDQALGQDLENRIVAALKEQCSPRHVPDEIIQVPDIPYTLTGKKMEVPVKRLFMGAAAEECFSRGMLRNPDAVDFIIQFCARRSQQA
jgi:acetoacetyl-CoA synthetase